jgi:hypothetical protein
MKAGEPSYCNPPPLAAPLTLTTVENRPLSVKKKSAGARVMSIVATVLDMARRAYYEGRLAGWPFNQQP